MSGPWLDDGDVRIHHGDALETLRAMPAGSVDCCITSPPYYGLRDYGVDGQIGLEDTPEAFIARLVDVFAQVRRVLADHGTCWVNLGDSYAVGGGGAAGYDDGRANRDERRRAGSAGAKPKDLLMMPARLALALQADGWWLRSDIIWAKPNPMPESVTDRPTSAHEHLFLLTKRPRYWYDAEAIKEPANGQNAHDLTGGRYAPPGQNGHTGTRNGDASADASRNARNVWTIATQPTPEAHFATYPQELVRRALLAGCPAQVCRECGTPRERIVERTENDPQPIHTRTPDGSTQPGNAPRKHGAVGSSRARDRGWTDCGHDAYRPGIVLDPFMGSGTTGLVARHHARHAVGIELSETYIGIAAKRLRQLSLLGGTA